MGQLRCQTLVAALFLPLTVGIANCGHSEIMTSVKVTDLSRSQLEATIVVQLGQSFGEFVVINRGEPVLLQSAVVVEQEVDGKWEEVPVTNLELREVCHPSPSPGCIKLGAGARLKPVPWTGNYCFSQCPSPCRLDGPAPAGIYRFVIRSCDSNRAHASPPFEKPASDRQK
jgi:hypothetical protein